MCELTGLSDGAAEYLAQLVKDKDSRKLSVINHLFRMFNEYYDFNFHETQGGNETANSILGALFLYFERFSDWDKFVSDNLIIGEDINRNILSAAYKQ